MVNINPYSDKDGNWYKGALHAHSIKSDGNLPPKELVKWYKDKGYNFLNITDHGKFTDMSVYSDNNFLAFNGEELDNPHVIALNIYKEIEDNKNFKGQIKAILKQNGIPIVAHPYWMGLTIKDLLKQKGYIAIEIYNYICEELNGKGSSLVHWDELLSSDRKVWGVAVDDAHFSQRHPNANKAWIMVRSNNLTKDKILDSIINGNFYSSTGPQIINIEVNSNIIIVYASSEVNLIRFIGRGYKGSCIEAVKKGEISYAEYKIIGDEKYIRIECVDRNNKTAWSNPLFLEA